MRHLVIALLAVVLIGCAPSNSAGHNKRGEMEQERHKPGSLLVQFKKDVSLARINSILEQLPLKEIKKLGSDYSYEIIVAGDSQEWAMESLKKTPEVQAVEKNRMIFHRPPVTNGKDLK